MNPELPVQVKICQYPVNRRAYRAAPPTTNLGIETILLEFSPKFENPVSPNTIPAEFALELIDTKAYNPVRLEALQERHKESSEACFPE